MSLKKAGLTENRGNSDEEAMRITTQRDRLINQYSFVIGIWTLSRQLSLYAYFVIDIYLFSVVITVVGVNVDHRLCNRKYLVRVLLAGCGGTSN